MAKPAGNKLVWSTQRMSDRIGDSLDAVCLLQARVVWIVCRIAAMGPTLTGQRGTEIDLRFNRGGINRASDPLNLSLGPTSDHGRRVGMSFGP